MRLYTYILTLCHDTGRVKIKTTAQNKKQAIKSVCLVEGCPERAIIKIIRK